MGAKQIKDYTFGIITPSFGRKSLVDQMAAVSRQTHPWFIQVVSFDGVDPRPFELYHTLHHNPMHDIRHLDNNFAKVPEQVIDSKMSKIEFISTEKATRDFGNTQRREAYYHLERIGMPDYLMHLDDDDMFDRDSALALLNQFINKQEKDPNIVLFPCHRFGQRFLNVPPGDCMTVTCQYIYKPVINGEKLIWLDGFDNHDYTADGKWIGDMAEKYGYEVFDPGFNLTRVDHANAGR